MNLRGINEDKAMKMLLLGLILMAHSWVYADFPQSYEHSRIRFLSQCQKVSGARKSFSIASESEKNLYVDICFKNRKNSQNLLILSSGVHGPEAYAGSAAQSVFLEKYIALPEYQNISVILVHAMNPYGFKTGRRVLENNVDLNRNFLTREEFLSAQNKGYEKLHELFNSKEKVGSLNFSFFKRLLVMAWKLLTKQFSKSEVRNALAQGQYQHSDEIFYGGAEVSPQVEIWDQEVRSRMNSYKQVVFVDFHTGLGVRGEMHVLTSHRVTDAEVQHYKRSFLDSEKKYFKITLPTDEGFYKTTGDILDFMHKEKRSQTQLYAFAAEFGTKGIGMVSQMKSLHLMSVENQGAHYGYNSKELEQKVNKQFRELFYPSDSAWQSEVLQKIDYLFSKPLPRLFQKEVF